jgi:hypothetical protein
VHFFDRALGAHVVVMLCRLLVLLLLAWCVSSLPCKNAHMAMEISTTQHALSLAEAAACEGGAVNVTWIGDVIVTRTIVVGSGTVLTIVGSASAAGTPTAATPAAVINGNSTTQLFEVQGGQLHLIGVSASTGHSAEASAVLTTTAGSVVTAVGCDLSDNRGALGAISLESESKLSLTMCSMNRNQVIARPGAKSGGSGGCIIAADNSEVFISNSAFVNNTAGSYSGGGVLVIAGTMELVNSQFYANNAGYGGAIGEHCFA